MKPKTIRILYWILTILNVIALIMDGMGGILRVQAGKDVLAHLGYPEYLLPFFGVAKILGALVLLQTKYQRIKEWVFAGLAFNYIGAFASRAFVGDEISLLVPPLVMLVITIFYYYIWIKFEQQSPDENKK